MAWKKLKKYLEKRRKENKWKSLKEKKTQSELIKNVDDDEHMWFQCNTDPRKTAAFGPTRANGRNNQEKEGARYGRPRAV